MCTDIYLPLKDLSIILTEKVFMNKQPIIDFFDCQAPQWDADLVRDEEVIARILDNAGIQPGASVLDVACGTGVLVPDYLKRAVTSVTGVDISSQMIALAKKKFSDPRVSFICADIETLRFENRFDCAVVYNAFPHFFEPENLIEKLAGDLKPGGLLTIAHGMSRASIDQHHEGRAQAVSIRLMPIDQLEKCLKPKFNVIVKISNKRMYQIVGERKAY
jgi:demethylmenaquinone methyltransferase/2-methoxy-6-polyprenyl-1,4-benzoquinol methylase